MSAPRLDEVLFSADLEYRMSMAVADHVCRGYLIDHHERLIPAMVLAAVANKEDGDVVVHRFVRGLHERHEAGLLVQPTQSTAVPGSQGASGAAVTNPS